MSSSIYVVGHQQPDTDTICSAVVYARLKQAQGTDAIPARAGEINPETQFVLDRWDVDTPSLIDDATGEQLILVDHNEYSQTVPGAIHTPRPQTRWPVQPFPLPLACSR
jgi:manganese-dependent inorganic pyrophosphatase